MVRCVHMTHDHEREIEIYGECITCGRSAVAARDAAIEAVEAGADPDWFARAMSVVVELARSGRPFTSDDVWDQLPTTAEPRALGAVMRRVAVDRLIAKTGRTLPSRRVENHARPLAEWVGTCT